MTTPEEPLDDNDESDGFGELDPDDDELTRTRKVRRAFIAQKYLVAGLASGAVKG